MFSLSRTKISREDRFVILCCFGRALNTINLRMIRINILAFASKRMLTPNASFRFLVDEVLRLESERRSREDTRRYFKTSGKTTSEQTASRRSLLRLWRRGAGVPRKGLMRGDTVSWLNDAPYSAQLYE